MIKVYVMETCPHCTYIEKQIEGNPRFEAIDIGAHVRNLREFLALRDSSPAFIEAKKVGDIGVPAYLLEDGSVTLNSADLGLEPMPEGRACSIDGTGC